MSEQQGDRPPRPQQPVFTGVGIALGAGLGVVLGLLVFDNVAVGIGIGVALGVVIGAALDAQRRRRPPRQDGSGPVAPE